MTDINDQSRIFDKIEPSKLKEYSHIRGKKITCNICHKSCSNNPYFLQLEVLEDVIFPFVLCSNCKHTFTEEEVKLMMNLFMLYGGFFGKDKLKPFSIVKILQELTSIKKNDTTLFQINTRLLHQALLHGISPNDYTEKLQQLVSSDIFL